MRNFRCRVVLAVLCVVAMAAFCAKRSLADAPAGQYMVINGTVFDTKTQLRWQQNVASVGGKTWDNAIAYCQSLSLDGAGWRLPSMKELQTLVDETKTSTTIDTTVFSDSPSGFFWTSSVSAEGNGKAWYINFSYGDAFTSGTGSAYRVRCVR